MPTMLNISCCRGFAGIALLGLLLAACSPRYNWREVRSNDARFTVLLPAKPATLTRPVSLGGAPVAMTMTAAEVDGVAFAVGSAELADAASADAALEAMEKAMLGNIHGSVRHATSHATDGGRSIELEAGGTPARGGDALLLVARFVARDRRVYQAIVLGPERSVPRPAVDTFLDSFHPD